MTGRIIGDYRYGSAVLDGQRYAIVRNRDAIERIRKITPTGNPVVWEEGQPLSDYVMAILAVAT
jgi:hypothetical protein